MLDVRRSGDLDDVNMAGDRALDLNVQPHTRPMSVLWAQRCRDRPIFLSVSSSVNPEGSRRGTEWGQPQLYRSLQKLAPDTGIGIGRKISEVRATPRGRGLREGQHERDP